MINDLPDDIDGLMWEAVKKKDEKRMKELIILAMKTFLKDSKNYTKELLDGTASLYLTVPIHLKWKDEFKFTDTKLRYVLEELSAIEVVPDKRAKENVKRFILYLEGKDYEKI